MSLERFSGNPIMTADKSREWKSRAVFNPCVQKENDKTMMLYRTLATGGITRVGGKEYHYSYIGYAESEDGINFDDRSKPFISPEESWESLGCEDPRFVKVDDTFYIFYTAVSPEKDGEIRVKIAGARTKDFSEIEKLGVISLEGRCKAASLFPEKISGKYSFLYTQDADSKESTIYHAELDSIEQLFLEEDWEKVKKTPLLIPSRSAYRGPELGAPPIKTEKGWLLVYCPESFRREWFIGAALLDKDDPKKVIAKTGEPLLIPEKNYELDGYVSNVVFPSGAVIMDEKLLVYYGGADQGICLATCRLNDLLSDLG